MIRTNPVLTKPRQRYHTELAEASYTQPEPGFSAAGSEFAPVGGMDIGRFGRMGVLTRDPKTGAYIVQVDA